MSHFLLSGSHMDKAYKRALSVFDVLLLKNKPFVGFFFFLAVYWAVSNAKSCLSGSHILGGARDSRCAVTWAAKLPGCSGHGSLVSSACTARGLAVVGAQCLCSVTLASWCMFEMFYILLEYFRGYKRSILFRPSIFIAVLFVCLFFAAVCIMVRVSDKCTVSIYHSVLFTKHVIRHPASLL